MAGKKVKIGEITTDGVYAGISSKTGKPMYIPDPDDSSARALLMSFQDAEEAIKNLAAHGHYFHLPSPPKGSGSSTNPRKPSP
jgi:hypothetical protein